jgi:hypothetical protein
MNDDPSGSRASHCDERTPDERTPKKMVRCNNCTIRLVRVCEGRAWWFGPARFPLVLGMQAMAWMHRIDPHVYDLRSDECLGCLRFLKLELKERSPIFRRLNKLINPHFDRIRDSLLTPEERAEARQRARDLYGSDRETK